MGAVAYRERECGPGGASALQQLLPARLLRGPCPRPPRGRTRRRVYLQTGNYVFSLFGNISAEDENILYFFCIYRFNRLLLDARKRG